MNIDYGKIIEAAEKRRENLEELTDEIGYAAGMVEKLREVRAWTTNLRSLYNNLDDEGKKLLPPGINTALSNMYLTDNHLMNALNVKTLNSGAAVAGVEWLVEKDDDLHI